MKNISYKIRNRNRGFLSLAEAIIAMTIGTVVLITVLGVYGRAERSAAAITGKLDNARLPSEILQRIAEDLDGILAAGTDTNLTFETKSIPGGYATARLQILNTIFDANNESKTFEKIIWQTSYDYDSDANGLVLYRSHSGKALEDKLLDENKYDWERELFVPICDGITFFSVQAIRGEMLENTWLRDSPPTGILVTISFVEPLETVTGDFEVPEDEKVTRTIAIDRARKVVFIFVPRKYEDEDKGKDKVKDEDENTEDQQEKDKVEDKEKAEKPTEEKASTIRRKETR